MLSLRIFKKLFFLLGLYFYSSVLFAQASLEQLCLSFHPKFITDDLVQIWFKDEQTVLQNYTLREIVKFCESQKKTAEVADMQRRQETILEFMLQKVILELRAVEPTFHLEKWVTEFASLKEINEDAIFLEKLSSKNLTFFFKKDEFFLAFYVYLKNHIEHFQLYQLSYKGLQPTPLTQNLFAYEQSKIRPTIIQKALNLLEKGIYLDLKDSQKYFKIPYLSFAAPSYLKSWTRIFEHEDDFWLGVLPLLEEKMILLVKSKERFDTELALKFIQSSPFLQTNFMQNRLISSPNLEAIRRKHLEFFKKFFCTIAAGLYFEGKINIQSFKAIFEFFDVPESLLTRTIFSSRSELYLKIILQSKNSLFSEVDASLKSSLSLFNVAGDVREAEPFYEISEEERELFKDMVRNFFLEYILKHGLPKWEDLRRDRIGAPFKFRLLYTYEFPRSLYDTESEFLQDLISFLQKNLNLESKQEILELLRIRRGKSSIRKRTSKPSSKCEPNFSPTKE